MSRQSIVRAVLRGSTVAALAASAASCSLFEPGRYPPPRPPVLPVCAGQLPDVTLKVSPRKSPQCRRRPAEILRVVRDERGELRRCYDAALRRNRRAAGRVPVRFAIAADGSVASACVHETGFADAELLECMTDVFADLEFTGLEDAGCNPTTVTYPIIFQPSAAEP